MIVIRQRVGQLGRKALKQDTESLTTRRARSIEAVNKPPGKNSPINPEEVPDPPGMFATIGAMGAGAAGAVFVAAVGVYGVFQLALAVAGGTGRTIHSNSGNEDSKLKTSSTGNEGGSGSNSQAAASPKEAILREITLMRLQGVLPVSYYGMRQQRGGKAVTERST